MDTKEIRRRNLEALVRDMGGGKKAELARMIDPDRPEGRASMISQVINKTRAMGEDQARLIERRLRLAPRWMDELRPAIGIAEEPPPPYGVTRPSAAGEDLPNKHQVRMSRLQEYLRNGRLSSADFDALWQVIERLARKESC